MTVIDHDGKKYLLLKVSSTAFDGSPGFDVMAVEITPAVIADWQAKFAIIDQLRAEHGDLEYIGFNDCSVEWRMVDYDSDPIDEDGEICMPLWDQALPRTEGDVLEVAPHYLEWRAMPKHTDDHVNALLWRSELLKVVEALAQLGGKCDGNHGAPRCVDPECWQDEVDLNAKAEAAVERMRRDH